MTDQPKQEPKIRSDEGIIEDIRALIRSYDPLKASREAFDFSVMNGVVRLEGHVQNKRSYRVLMDNVPDIKGVQAVDDSNLYDDETLMYNVGQLLPRGIRVRVDHGDVTLIGKAQDAEVDIQDLMMDIAEVPGVASVEDMTRR